MLASEKPSESRAIAIVFDNSGSMYDDGDQAWCRATYAMEVFASMLNDGDVLQIYPMNPITVGNNEYTMQEPFQITDAKQASSIREILTKDAGGTPIESIDSAVAGIQRVQSDKKYVIVLTDGGTFSKNGNGLSRERTVAELDKRIDSGLSQSLSVMYLGIGSEACIPNTAESERFAKRQAINTADVLSTLTDMCNLIFGRDTLPKNHLSGNEIDFDISMKKLIVFVQGDNISNLKISPVQEVDIGNPISTQGTKYSTLGASDYKSVPDTSLQGMMVTYGELPAGKYNIDYQGEATSVEVYYEPDADLEFIFTDAEGNNVDLNDLYEGEYKVSFGLKDAKTGELISSDLLGSPSYEGSYSINGQKTSFSHEGQNGEVPITLKMNDSFEADLTVTYLSGYSITKGSSDFGWPQGGVKVLAPPLGKFKVELTIPKDYILIKEIDETPAFAAELTIDGRELTSEEFDAVEISVDCDGLPQMVTADKGESRYLIELKDDKGIDEGDYDIAVKAHYIDIANREAESSDSASITLSNTPLWIKWSIRIAALLLLLIILWVILHIKVLPKYIKTSKNQSSMIFDGDDVTKSTNFTAEIKKKGVKAQAQYGGRKFGLSMDVIPGKESYLYKSNKKRTAEVKVASVKKFGPANIQEAMIGSTKYIADENTGKLVPAMQNTRPFLLKNGMIVKYSGTIKNAGIDKDFEVTSKLSFKRK